MARVLILYYISMEDGKFPTPIGNPSGQIIINPNQPPVRDVPPPPPQNVPLPIVPPGSNNPPVPLDHSEGFFHRYLKLIKIGLLLLIVLSVLFVLFLLMRSRSVAPETGKVTLTYWTFEDDSQVMATAISDFEEANPNIKINYVVNDSFDYVQKLEVRIPNGNGPDIFRFHNTWYPILKDELLPLPKETIEKSVFEDNYYPVSQSDLIKNGAIYGIPLGIDTLVLYTNPKIFDSNASESGEVKIPLNWQEFIEVSQVLTKRNDEGGIDISGGAIGTFDNVNNASDILSLLFAQNGVNLENFSDSETKISDALVFYTNFALLEDNIWDESLDNSLEMFASEKLAMYFGFAKDYKEIKKINPNIRVQIAPVPQLLSEKKYSIANYFAEGVSAKSAHQKEALLFMKYLASPQVQEKLYNQTLKTAPIGVPFSNKKLAEKLIGTEAQVFIDEAKTAVSSPFSSVSVANDLNDSLNQVLKGVVNSMLTGEKEDEAANQLKVGFDTVMEQISPQASPVEE